MLEFTFNARACDERTCQPPTGVRQVQISTHAPCIGSSSPARAVIVNLDALSFADIATQRPAFDVVSGAPITRAFANRMYHNSTDSTCCPNSPPCPTRNRCPQSATPTKHARATDADTDANGDRNAHANTIHARARRPPARPAARMHVPHARGHRSHAHVGHPSRPDARVHTRARRTHLRDTHLQHTEPRTGTHTPTT